MSLAELTLDEIIARQKMSRGRRNKRRGRGYAPKYKTPKNDFTKLERVPEGRWDHDGYYQLYSDDNDHLRINDDYLFGRQDVLSRSCIHISNLVPSVISDDIKSLVSEYDFDSVAVNYDEDGNSLCTADIVTDRVSAKAIMQSLTGIAIDGQIMGLHLIERWDVAPAADRSPRKSFDHPYHPYRGWRSGQKRYFRQTDGQAGNRRHLTDEELDRELDAYMSRKKGGSAA